MIPILKRKYYLYFFGSLDIPTSSFPFCSLETRLPLGYHRGHEIWMNGNMTVTFHTRHLCPARSAPLTWWCFWPAPTTVWRRGCTNEPSSRDDRMITPRPSTAAWPTSNKTPFPSSNTSRREASLSRWGWYRCVCVYAQLPTRNTLRGHFCRCLLLSNLMVSNPYWHQQYFSLKKSLKINFLSLSNNLWLADQWIVLTGS